MEWIINNLRDIVERCMEAKEVLDKEGNSLGYCSFNAQGAIRALELLGKHLGMFADRVKVGGDGNPIEHHHNIRKQVIVEIFQEINGATRGLPSKRLVGVGEPQAKLG